MGAHARNGQAWHVERLGVDGAIDRVGVDQTKLVHVYVRRVQHGFIEIRACAPKVVMFGGNRYLSSSYSTRGNQKQKGQ